MGKDCKYIMLDDNFPILFHCGFNHKEIANKFIGHEITSAGFVEVRDNTVYTFGESVSLKLKPEKDDAYWIKKLLVDVEY